MKHEKQIPPPPSPQKKKKNENQIRFSTGFETIASALTLAAVFS